MAIPPAGALRLRREERAPAVDGVRVAAVPVAEVEGLVFVEDPETAVFDDLEDEVEPVTRVDPLTDEPDEAAVDAEVVEVEEAPIEKEPVVA